jgi:hypothetical protein
VDPVGQMNRAADRRSGVNPSSFRPVPATSRTCAAGSPR